MRSVCFQNASDATGPGLAARAVLVPGQHEQARRARERAQVVGAGAQRELRAHRRHGDDDLCALAELAAQLVQEHGVVRARRRRAGRASRAPRRARRARAARRRGARPGGAARGPSASSSPARCCGSDEHGHEAGAARGQPGREGVGRVVAEAPAAARARATPARAARSTRGAPRAIRAPPTWGASRSARARSAGRRARRRERGRSARRRRAVARRAADASSAASVRTGGEAMPPRPSPARETSGAGGRDRELEALEELAGRERRHDLEARDAHRVGLVREQPERRLAVLVEAEAVDAAGLVEVDRGDARRRSCACPRRRRRTARRTPRRGGSRSSRRPRARLAVLVRRAAAELRRASRGGRRPCGGALR